ncbi:hypothetical protein RhiirA4_415656 [Rhizophagus irregularis]|uniref:Uncharacterized protein n=1 Tax=Rhizophagus irregularis TaxID=588596 RepID=A0A2I1G0N3_9GLOM|nr:hypothetical protein RhiirA4_415656 [Rhizophagus irregularis]
MTIDICSENNLFVRIMKAITNEGDPTRATLNPPLGANCSVSGEGEHYRTHSPLTTLATPQHYAHPTGVRIKLVDHAPYGFYGWCPRRHLFYPLRAISGTKKTPVNTTPWKDLRPSMTCHISLLMNLCTFSYPYGYGIFNAVSGCVIRRSNLRPIDWSDQ